MLGLFAAVIEEEGHLLAPMKNDLELSFGSFSATSTGVCAVLKPPLDLYSGHHPWHRVAMGLGFLRLFFAGEDAAIIDRFVTMLMTDRDRDLLEKIILADENLLYDESTELVEWGASLASRCPYKSVGHDLEHLPSLCGDLLDDFVRHQVTRV